MAPRILIFSIVPGAEYLFHLKFIVTYALIFFGYIIDNYSLARVMGVPKSGKFADIVYGWSPAWVR